jgi:hypothetical protein
VLGPSFFRKNYSAVSPNGIATEAEDSTSAKPLHSALDPTQSSLHRDIEKYVDLIHFDRSIRATALPTVEPNPDQPRRHQQKLQHSIVVRNDSGKLPMWWMSLTVVLYKCHEIRA